MTFWRRLFGRQEEESGTDRLYRNVVAAGRDPAWYVDGEVPDTVDGRFDMIAGLLSLVLLRLEAEGEPARLATVALAERFADDMNGNLRQIGIGDLVVGKHVTRMMGALGGRLGAFRDAAPSGSLEPAVRRNIFRDAPPSDAAVGWVAERLGRYRAEIDSRPLEALLDGDLPKL